MGLRNWREWRAWPLIWLFLLITAWLVLQCLTGCVSRTGGLDIGITKHHDFSEMVPALVFFCVIGIAASIAAFLWVPIQKWIPLACGSFFALCIVTAYTVQWLIVWLPWIIGGGMAIGLLWLIPYLRRLLIDIRANWDKPADAQDPPLITKIMKKVR